MTTLDEVKLLRRVRTALLLVLFGLVVQLLMVLYWTPLTFIFFTGLGFGGVGIGGLLFIRSVWSAVERDLPTTGEELEEQLEELGLHLPGKGDGEGSGAADPDTARQEGRG